MTADHLGSTLTHALETAYLAIAEISPDLLRHQVIFVTGSGKNPRSTYLGHWAQDRWQETNAKTTVHELFISGEVLHQGATQTFQTLLHECAHALATIRKLKDTSRQGRYHNKTHFLPLAEELGLIWPENTKPCPTRGFSAVTITPPTIELFKPEIARLDRAIRLSIQHPTVPATPTKPAPKILITFTNGQQLTVPPALYTKLQGYLALAPHTAKEI